MGEQFRTYSELKRFNTHESRYEYLRLLGTVGASTFGHERFVNQDFYRSSEWKNARYQVISRDRGLDLGIEGFEIFDKIIVHHMNPISEEDIIHGNLDILDPEFLICCTQNTHNAIHFGDKSKLVQPWVERQPGDTLLWGRDRIGGDYGRSRAPRR